jgi:flagellar motility protein MotE (MotC chaperone)
MKRFKFPLDPLLKKQGWDVDGLRSEKASATQAVNQIGQGLRDIEHKITAACEDARQLAGEDSAMLLVRRDLLITYVKDQVARADIKRKELEQAREIEAQVAEQLVKAMQQLKTLERLRDQARSAHDYQVLQAQLNEADESWLARRNHV